MGAKWMGFCLFVLSVLSVIGLGCSDDSSGDNDAARAAQVDSIIEEVVKSFDDTYRALCTCEEQWGGDDVQTCLSNYTPTDGSLPACQKEAARCHIDNYTAAMSCRRDANNSYVECIQSCPLSGGITACRETRNTELERCDTLFNADIINAFNLCAQGQTPVCPGAGGSTPGGPNTGGGKCVSQQEFIDKIVNRRWADFYLASSGGIMECERGEDCIKEELTFFEDGTLTWVWTSFRYGSTSGRLTTRCSFGTWLLNCNKLTLSDCEYTDTSALVLTAKGFSHGARNFEPAQVYIDPNSSMCTERVCR